MSKQDGYASRTPADLERKYKFGETFAEVFGLVTDARKIAEEAQSAIEGLDQEQIFNLLTNNGKAQGIYRDDKGDVYVNASFIKSGKLAAQYIDAENLKVNAANITGTLTIGQLPSNVAKTSDLSGFVDEATVTTITNNAIKTASIYADQIASGGTISGCRLETKSGVWTNIVIDEDSIVFGDHAFVGLGTDGRLGVWSNKSQLDLAGYNGVRIFSDMAIGEYYWEFYRWGLALISIATGEPVAHIDAVFY